MNSQFRSRSNATVEQPSHDRIESRPPDKSVEARIQAELQILNRSYLQLLIDDLNGAVEVSPRYWLSDPMPMDLLRLSENALLSIAAVRFSLFELSFESCRVWGTVGGTHNQVAAQDRHASFMNTALFLCWHLTNASDRRVQMYSRLWFGLSRQAIESLQSLSLSQLMASASSAHSALRPRWPKHQRFWPDLIAAAAARDAAGLASIDILGRQLLAADVIQESP